MAKRADLIGQRFGRLVIEEYAFTKNNRAYWKCRCDCGNYTEVPTYSLKCGNTTSCGCFHLERIREPRPESRLYVGDYTSKNRPRLYWVWYNMVRRCEDQKSSDYSRYGARGISVCKEWHDLPTFLEWAYSHGWKEGLTIDRIDNNDGYYPENCRWVDAKAQGGNKRNNHFIEFNGKRQILSDWSIETGLTPNCILSRLKSGWSVEEALTKPSSRKQDR